MSELERELLQRSRRASEPRVGAAVDPRSLIAEHHDIERYLELKHAAESMSLGSTYFEPHCHLPFGQVRRPDGTVATSFSSFDYLGLSQHSAVIDASRSAAAEHGTSASAARIVGGELPDHRLLERELAEFVGTEDAALFVSGYLTNVALLPYLLSAKDVVIHDELVHASLIGGARSSEAQRYVFRHNDLDHLEEILTQHRARYEGCMIVVDSIYSMDGDMVDLPALLKIARGHDSEVYIDEAHSLGVLGASGAGICDHFGITPGKDVLLMGTLSKSLASFGGYVAGPETLIGAIRQYCPGAGLYCTGLPPSIVASARSALNILRNTADLCEDLRGKAMKFRKALLETGLEVPGFVDSPVVPVLIRDSLKAIQLADLLVTEGVIVYAIFYPVVPDGESRLRFFVSSAHTEEELDRTACAVTQAASNLGII